LKFNKNVRTHRNTQQSSIHWVRAFRISQRARKYHYKIWTKLLPKRRKTFCVFQESRDHDTRSQDKQGLAISRGVRKSLVCATFCLLF